MSAYYDRFDYPSYWTGREYEHRSEILAISSFLNKIQNIDKVLEIGGGYGRLVSTYLPRAKKILFSDPSSKLLSIANKKINSDKVSYLHTAIENIDKKIKGNKFDVVVMVRVLHHIKNICKTFKSIYKLLDNKGFLILEFPNKLHSKAVFKELLKGNFTILYDFFPKDVRSPGNIQNKCISFNNYHPGYIIELLKSCGFDIVEIRSVSNVRNEFLKKHIPLKTLNRIEELLQIIFSWVYFGPSTFVLAQKK